MTGLISLETSQISAGERDGTVLVPIRRTGDLSGEVIIQFGTDPDTATAGADFVDFDGQVTLAAGQSRILVPITLINDSLSESTETLSFSIIRVSSGSLTAPRTARIDILDDENPVTPPTEPPLTSNYQVTTDTVVSGLNNPIAIEFAPQSPSRIYLADKGGFIKVFDVTTGATVSTFVDISQKVNFAGDRGLLDIALHPNFPSQPYVYAFYVVDPPDTAGKTGLDRPDGEGNRFAYVVRFTADAATGYTTAIPGSETILVGGAGRTLADISGNGAIDFTDPAYSALRASDIDPGTGAFRQDYIKVDSLSHAGGSLAFGPDGALYISVGDGTSYNYADPRTANVQNINSLNGKILRVDPMTGAGLANNPFVDAGESLSLNQSKVFQLGLRNPFAMAFDANGKLIVSETGWYSWEEINSGAPGANFGWPYYEGGDNGALNQTPVWRDSPGAAAFYAAVAAGTVTVTAPFRAFSHAASEPGFSNGAIVGANSVYTGSRYPTEFLNDYFFNDIITGNIFTVDTLDRRDVKYIYTATGSTAGGALGPVHFKQGPDGYMYYVDLYSGTVGRINIAATPGSNTPPVASNDAYTVANTGTISIAGSAARNTGVLANDTDANGDLLTVTAVNGAAFINNQDIRGTNGGNFRFTNDGGIQFLPGTDFAALVTGQSATSSAAYTVSDGRGGTSSATVTVTVTGTGTTANTPPVARNDAIAVSETQNLFIDGSPLRNTGPLANDTDANGDLLTVIAVNGGVFGPGQDFRGSNGGTFRFYPDGGLHFLPGNDFLALNTGQSATTSIGYTVSDGRGGTSSATVTATVNGVGTAVNTPPVAVNDAYTVAKTGTISIAGSTTRNTGVLANDTDANGDLLTVTAVNGAAFINNQDIRGSNGGTFRFTNDGGLQFLPGADFSGLLAGQSATSSAAYTVSDGRGGTSSANVTVTVQGSGTATNTPPVAVNDTYTVAKTGTISIPGSAARNTGVLANDTDANGDLLTVTAVNGAAFINNQDIRGSNGGTFRFTNDGGLQFLPGSDFSGLGTGQSATSAAAYTVSDGRGGTSSATVTVTVQGSGTAGNSPPVARNDAITVSETQNLFIDGSALRNTGPLANDTDANGDLLTVIAVNGASFGAGQDFRGSNGGTFRFYPDGGLHFLPGNDFISLNTGQSATTSIGYTVSDGRGGTSSATVTATINGVGTGGVTNTPPVAVNDSYTVAKTGTIAIAGSAARNTGVLANDTDANGDLLTVTAVNGATFINNQDIRGSNGGTFRFTNDGGLQFLPGSDFSGLLAGQSATSSAAYTVSDGRGGTSSANVTVTIQGSGTGTNTPPVARNDSFTLSESQNLFIDGSALRNTGPLANDTDADGDLLTVISVNGNSFGPGQDFRGSNGGTFRFYPDGGLHFIPGTDFLALNTGQSATTSMNYTVSDGHGGTSTATVSVLVNGVTGTTGALSLFDIPEAFM